MQDLLGGPRAGLARADVAEALALGRGATVRHGADVLTGGDVPTDARLRFESGSVTWSYRAPDRVTGQSQDVAAVRRRATLRVPAGQPVNLTGGRLRLWTEMRLRTGAWARFHLGVFVVVTPGALEDDGTRLLQQLVLADKSHTWQNDLLVEPVTVPGGTVIVDYVKTDLTARYGETMFAIAGSPALLEQTRTFEPGTSRLELYSQLLEAAAMDQLTADEDGRPASQALALLAGRGPEQTYGPGAGKVLSAGTVEPLLPTLPNVVRFSARQGPSLGNVEGNGLAIRRNTSTGPASIAARGGRAVPVTVDVEADSQAVLEAIADADCQRYFAGGGLRWVGKVGLNPRHSDRDVIALELARLGLTGGAWSVTDWTYPLQPISGEQAVLMDLTAERRVLL